MTTHLHGIGLRDIGTVLLLLAGLLGTIRGPNNAADRLVGVDLELILAVDVSPSMNAAEQQLQRDGYVNALRHPDFLSAIASGRLGRIAITYFEWAGARSQRLVVPWAVLEQAGDADAFAAALAAAAITADPGTSISGSLMMAMDLFAASPARSTRRVIDISGDGANNTGPPLAPIRDALLARGVVINGLPIMLPAGGAPDRFTTLSGKQLKAYYQNCVIGGPGAFLLGVDDPSHFDIAIRRKLVLEVAARQPSVDLAAHRGARRKFDCLSIGERPGR